jgi:hypothetical protein
MSKLASEPYSSISGQLDEAIGFAEYNQHFGLALLLGQLRHSPDWRLSVVRSPEGVAGVSVILADGTWSLEAKNELVALVLAEIAGQTRRARVLLASESVRGWLRPRLVSKGCIVDEGKTILMHAISIALTGSGSLATQKALPELKVFWGKVHGGNGPVQAPAWRSLVAFGELAVATRSGRIVAAVAFSGRTETRAGLSLYRVPRHVGQFEVLRQLVAFVAHRLIADGKALFAQVDGNDTEAIELYRSLGFTEVQAGYCEILKP